MIAARLHVVDTSRRCNPLVSPAVRLRSFVCIRRSIPCPQSSRPHRPLSHGTVQGTPWHPLTGADEFDPVLSFNQVDAQLWQSLGHNLMRLGTMWPGVVPSRDQVNSTYLDVMTNLTAMSSSYGIFTLLDFHQDTFSTRFCGEGESIW
jgi:hypothetical protein